MDIKNVLIPSKKEKIYIPNEIFSDLMAIDGLKPKDISFLYTYFCLVTYMYRYCKYTNGHMITNQVIKQILGYAAKYGGVDSLIKTNGVIDRAGYTLSSKKIPIGYIFDEYGFQDFTYIETKDRIAYKFSNNYSVKLPVKAFYRSKESYAAGELDGVYYDIANTHLFEINTYIAMQEQGLNLDSFYLYQYLTYKNSLHTDGYKQSYRLLGSETGLKERRLFECILSLEEKGYIEVDRGSIQGHLTEANTYKVRKSNFLEICKHL